MSRRNPSRLDLSEPGFWILCLMMVFFMLGHP